MHGVGVHADGVFCGGARVSDDQVGHGQAGGQHDVDGFQDLYRDAGRAGGGVEDDVEAEGCLLVAYSGRG